MIGHINILNSIIWPFPLYRPENCSIFFMFLSLLKNRVDFRPHQTGGGTVILEFHSQSDLMLAKDIFSKTIDRRRNVTIQPVL